MAGLEPARPACAQRRDTNQAILYLIYSGKFLSYRLDTRTDRPTDKQINKHTRPKRYRISGQYVVGVPEVLPTWIISHYLLRVTGSDALAIFPSGRMIRELAIYGANIHLCLIPSPIGMSSADDL